MSSFILDPEGESYFKDLRQIYEASRFENDRIQIRRLKATDITDQYVDYYQQKDLVQYFNLPSRPIDRNYLLQELEAGEQTGNYHHYGIFDKTKDLVIGHIRIGHIIHPHKIADLATFIGNKAYLGKGIAQDAIRFCNQLSFEKYDMRKLHSWMFEPNMASVMAYLKTGWVIEGILKGQYLVDGKALDRICVAHFNPRYFTPQELEAFQKKSDAYLAQIKSTIGA